MVCNHKITLKSGDVVPCGKCHVCLANQRSEWIFRLQQEFLVSSFSLFVTLTYNDEHLPADMSVNKRDVQLFHKRLRKHFSSGELRFYVVSEYGDHTFRPHYHGLYFFKNIHDKKTVYDIFESSWKQGFIKFGEVEEGSIVYCTKYCLKHSSTPEGRAETFRLVSKMNGGLGLNYLENMKDYHLSSENYMSVFHNGKRSRMPRYYLKKLGIKRDKNVLFDDMYSSAKENFEKSYRAFCLTHHYDTFEESINAFNNYCMKVAQNADELVIKHCKKQKF